MPRWIAASALAIVAAWLTVSLGAQTPPVPAGQTPGQPTFRTRIDAVSVDAIVTDKAGKPVTDLTAADFEVKEDGKVQKVESFKLVQIDDAVDPDPATMRQIVSDRDQEREAARDDVRLIVIFLDDYHVRKLNSIAMRERLAAFIRTISPRDLVAVMYPLTPVTGLTFSRNREELAVAIERFTGRKYDYFVQNPAEESYQYATPQQKEMVRDGVTRTALRGICTYLGTLREGRKTVLFVSEGLGVLLPASMNGGPPGAANPQLDSLRERGAFQNDQDQLRETLTVVEDANRSNTAIYTLDPRGLATGEFDMSDGSVDYATDRRSLTSTQDMLRTIADQTGGRAIVNRNDFRTDLGQMLRDSGAYYLLGYTSSAAPRDGKFHDIKVSVKRKDVDIRARKGYWAYTADEAARASAPPKPSVATPILSALNALDDSPRAHAVRTWVATARGADGKTEVTLVWQATPVAGASGPAVARASVTAIDPAGAAPYFRGVVERDPAAPDVSGRVTFDVRPGVFRVRVIATAAGGEVIDTEEQDITAPDFTGTAPVFSTPLIFRGRTARDVQQIRAATAPVPTLGREFTRAERLLLRFHVYGPAGTTPAVTMRLLNRAGQPMAALPPPVATADGGFEAEIGLASLAAGDYVIELAATAATGSAQTLIAVRITS